MEFKNIIFVTTLEDEFNGFVKMLRFAKLSMAQKSNVNSHLDFVIYTKVVKVKMLGQDISQLTNMLIH